MSLEIIFARLGYPRHADKVYECLASNQSAQSVSALGQACQLPRVTIYRCLKSLQTDGLIETEQVGKRTLYIAGHPQQLEKIIAITNDKQRAIVAANFNSETSARPRHIRMLYGADGIRQAFDDVIAHIPRGDVFYRYTSESDLAKVNTYLSKDYRALRDKKKLERLVISNATSRNQKKSRLERFIKVVPNDIDVFEHNIIQLVYGARTSIIDLESEEVLIIENKRFAEFQKTIFKLLYKRL